MSFKLAGVVSLGQLRNKSAFLIPFFRSEISNQLFAQELGPDKLILEFRSFDPTKYTILPLQCEPYERSPGDLGILAYFRVSDSVVVGPADQIIQRLKDATLKDDESPFFELDAYYLTEEVSKILPTIASCAKLFANAGLAAGWAELERAASRNQQFSAVSDDGQTATLSSLRAGFEDPDWPKTWLHHWQSSGYDEHVSDVGLEYADYAIGRTNEELLERAAQVLTDIANFPGFLRAHARARDRIVSQGHLYLNTLPTTSKFWPDIFVALAETSFQPTPVEVDTILSFFDAGLWESRLPPSKWMDVLSLLWKFDPSSERLLAAVIRLLRVIGNSSDFVGKLLMDTKFQINKPPISELVEKWLDEGELQGRLWISVYLRMAREMPANTKLGQIGLQWLRSESRPLRKWPSVYEVVATQMGETDEMRALARRWAANTDWRVSTWPKVALRVLKAFPTDEVVRGSVLKWLRTRPSSPLAWELSMIVQSRNGQRR